MVIAVTYDNGKVSEHLGTTLDVKFYTVADGKVASTEMETLKAAGHRFVAVSFFKHFSNVVITGRTRPSAVAGLEASGLEVIAGAGGMDADAAVEAYLAGQLKHDPEALAVEEVCAHDDDEDHEH